VGRVYEFRIIEYKQSGRNLVVSRRALLVEEQRAGAAEVRRSIVAGAVLTGRVTSVRESVPSSTWELVCRACAREAEEVREYTDRADAAPPEGFGSLADKLLGALKPREK
jgi:hypothetical protein